ncbi:aminotransferase class I/II-fold pyridoxal phosphate-dependent enzyme [Rathayibacter iranicus]|uniref:Aminotransferase class V-fold PLP-dependent enzyme n=2 Tax=Rathayibacter iranicus TaxID=59737 RepID=A0AAD1AEA8_9MICO|nr:aminotransferase class I/II-fold pyridoxal phosphate-dependent enzyme [Rathayibacter iranicus]AZZ54611.1 aminotransferase class V-fold PLP-dependent enzyme [Rathayibacter iranicus]MWV30395.1 aminotransferase class I/II-fold pyridoxal phosphate-dependent enzyme [Rathayibacter iranicus NCPPB 2253 = VKM Ac-1602]PPI51188.1 aminotransferase [Rathayibacter iranicus]PPI63390.1 aminotransferase [Rathayibacter iranicus]PPI74100.1 aminotransferase [Rathayibacter iranicus]
MSISGSWSRAAAGAGLLGPSGEVATTVFSEMSALAQRTGAVNLGQGFPDEDGPREVLEAAQAAIASGVNQYPPGPGFPVLREAIATHQRRFYGLELDPDGDVLVTTGATEALAATLLALLEPGDEVVTFTPHYDAYGALIALAGGVHRTVRLRGPSFTVDHDELAAAVTDRTRIILVNDPHNPTGAVLSADTRHEIVRLAERHDAVIVTDEVYEHLRFDTPHVPLATLPGAFERTLSISSAGKTFSTTGWKIGWIGGPRELVTAVLAVKQFLTYVSGAPFQGAVALGLRMPDSFFTGIAATLAQKRDLLSAGLAAAGFGVAPSSSGYFVVADAAPLGFADGVALCRELPRLAGVVAVPVSAFCRPEDAAPYRSLVRFAFCKRFEVLEEAVAGLAGMVR